MSGEGSKPLSTAWAVKNVAAMRDALDRHNSDCEYPAEAFLLNPYDQGC